jgi:hypothetical protein
VKIAVDVVGCWSKKERERILTEDLNTKVIRKRRRLGFNEVGFNHQCR